MVARGTHPNSLANLAHGKRFEPGHGNTTLARGPVITPAMRRYAEMPTSELLKLDVNKLPVREAIAVTYLVLCLKEEGDRARAEVADRLDGKVKDVLETRTADDDPWMKLARSIRQAQIGNG